jgi:hypothetical protein
MPLGIGCPVAVRTEWVYFQQVNFSSFWSDLLAGLIGSGVGIVVGLRIERHSSKKKAETRDERLVQNLINRLAGKRTFSHASDIGEVDDADDRKRCAHSILDARERISTVCDEIEQREDVIPYLRQMEQDCNAYLNYCELEPLRYAMSLVRLGEQLALQENELQRRMSPLTVELPGSRNADRPAWLP